MEPNWSPMRYSPVNDDDTGSVSNTDPDISGVHGTVAHDDNGMDLELVPYTQPDSGHTGQTLYSTNHYSGPELDMAPIGVHPDIFPTPGQPAPRESNYGWFTTSSCPDIGYMEGVESTQNTGMMYSANPERSFGVMNYYNNNNFHRSVVLPPSSFNRNYPGLHGMDSMVPEGTPMHDYADIHAQSHNFGLDLHLDPTLTIPTSAMPNSMPIPALAPALPPLTPTEPVITTATPTMVADYDYNYGHDYDPNHGTPAPDPSEQEPSTSASNNRNKTGNGKRVYRTSYDYHASHRYTCHPCRFSTDAKRDFARHEDTGKHKRKLQIKQTRGQQRYGKAGEMNEIRRMR